MIKLSNVTKKYNGFKGVNSINFEITKPGIYALLGHNASGKTTIIKTMCGLILPEHGTVEIQGVRKRSDFFKVISYMPDALEYPSNLTIKEVRNFVADMNKDFSKKTFDEMLGKFDINMGEFYFDLSKGKKMAVRLALTLSRNTQIYVLDEPLSGIDVLTRELILSEIIANMSEDKYFILSSHELHDIDKHIDDIIVVNEGAVVGMYNVDEIKHNQGLSLHEWYIETFSKFNTKEEE